MITCFCLILYSGSCFFLILIIINSCNNKNYHFHYHDRYEEPVNSLEDLLKRKDIVPSVLPNDPNHLMFMVR